MSKTYRRKWCYHGAIIRRRGDSYQAEINIDGQRIRMTGETLTEAEDLIDRKQTELENLGTAALRLTDKQRLDAADAIKKLGAVSLVKAADYYIAHHPRLADTHTVKQLMDEYVEAKEKANRRPDTVADIRHRIGRFAETYGDHPVQQITPSDLESWLDRNKYREQTRINFLRVFSGFFNFARKRGLTTENPAAKDAIDRPKLDEHLPEIYTPAEIERLLRAAEKEAQRLVPVLAIGFFAGLRTSEIEHIDWSDVDFQSKLITVRPEVAKRRRQRHVAMSDNLLAWLLPFSKPKGQICPVDSVFRCLRDSAIKASKLKKWLHNGMRHSFGSYHLTKHGDMSRTALELGHTRPDVLFRHYRNLVKPADAETYWRICPSPKA